MLTESLPIEIFVTLRFAEKAILNITENWRIDAEKLHSIIVGYFREMGIFEVQPKMEAELTQILKVWLQNSPEIYGLVKKAEAQDLLRRQSRRPE